MFATWYYCYQKRFGNLEQQSRDISQDLSTRAEGYLATMSSEEAFYLSSSTGDSETQFGLVEQEALRLWITRFAKRELQLSFDHMCRIQDQIQFYPDRLQWTLDVGDNWGIRRNGNALTVMKNKGGGETEPSGIHSTSKESHSWEIVRTETDATGHNHGESSLEESPSDTVELCFNSFPKHFEKSTLAIKRVRDIGNMKFIPPWRKGRSAVKVREFLRGQKVPLHCRDPALVLCFADSNVSNDALAVYLEDYGTNEAGKWIIHSDFEHKNGMSLIKVLLKKYCSNN